MNTNPDAIRILCFGDSKTWGQKQDRSGRLPINKRWTGLLQAKLGDGFCVIEEGLGGRTINIDDPRRPGRNGLQYLNPCIESHSPLDMIVVMLGTNDLKLAFGQKADGVAVALRSLIAEAKLTIERVGMPPAKFVIVSPIHINATAKLFTEFYTGYYDQGSMEESKKFAELFQACAEEHNGVFVDAATVAEPGEDGLHMTEESQEALAELMCSTIRKQL